MKFISFFSFVLLILPGLMTAKPTQDDYVFYSDNGSVNWSQGVITIRGTGTFPEVIKDPNNPRYDRSDPKQVRNRAQAKLAARSRAMEDALRNASDLIMGLPVGDGKILGDFSANTEILGKLNAFINGKYKIRDIEMKRVPFSGTDFRTGTEILTIVLSYDIFGENGLLSLNDSDEFSDNFMNFDYEHFPASSTTNGKNWEGLVISAPFLKITPVLAPKIFSESGKLIYDASKVLKDEALKSGVIGYARTPFNQPKDVSLRFYHCTAVGTVKNKGWDIIISNEDADQILCRARTVTSLRHCRVVVLVADGNR